MFCMMNFLIILFLMSCIMFMFMKHPLSMGMILLIQTITISMITGLLNYNFWFSYILFLVMIGGMLILFIYMTSIISNKKFKFNSNLFLFLMMISIMLILMFIINDQYMTNPYTINMNLIEFENKYNLTLTLNKFFNYPNYYTLFLLFNYLLITLIAVVKICDIKSGPLRQKF
uniref:NADH-ubiquinone oxidoreductase chain 6 n=1 Tax=Erotylidae sp. BMNH 1274391 TaxID=1796503 RepID=A0A126TFS4_9CUCU|nr:NADH dehydrogenase subunit 6 [Erotylidae sp. BMNH 1274391]